MFQWSRNRLTVELKHSWGFTQILDVLQQDEQLWTISVLLSVAYCSNGHATISRCCCACKKSPPPHYWSSAPFLWVNIALLFLQTIKASIFSFFKGWVRFSSTLKAARSQIVFLLTSPPPSLLSGKCVSGAIPALWSWLCHSADWQVRLRVSGTKLSPPSQLEDGMREGGLWHCCLDNHLWMSVFTECTRWELYNRLKRVGGGEPPREEEGQKGAMEKGIFFPWAFIYLYHSVAFHLQGLLTNEDSSSWNRLFKRKTVMLEMKCEQI